jgi:hypothetical protein
MEDALERQRDVDRQLGCTLVDAFALARASGQLDLAWSPETAALALKSLMSGLLSDFLRNRQGRDLAAEAAAAVRPLFRAFRGRARPGAVAAPPLAERQEA